MMKTKRTLQKVLEYLLYIGQYVNSLKLAGMIIGIPDINSVLNYWMSTDELTAFKEQFKKQYDQQNMEDLLYYVLRLDKANIDVINLLKEWRESIEN